MDQTQEASVSHLIRLSLASLLVLSTFPAFADDLIIGGSYNFV